jgi:hypothetical protein
MVHCAGCHCNFSVSGYTHHLRFAQSSSCIAAYHAQLEHENDVEIVDDEDDLDVPEHEIVDDEDNAPAFAGDFFGDYEDEDFDWPDEGMSIVDVHFHLLIIAQMPKKIL